eukprot:GDKI01037073.1.p1 GENE.GDKI01037073.1~~GDKI01037073.1.p1  ORF type:complete len:139 (+),score=32.55 GDKI01037073.1:284-700(+)
MLIDSLFRRRRSPSVRVFQMMIFSTGERTHTPPLEGSGDAVSPGDGVSRVGVSFSPSGDCVSGISMGRKLHASVTKSLHAGNLRVKLYSRFVCVCVQVCCAYERQCVCVTHPHKQKEGMRAQHCDDHSSCVDSKAFGV